jgi:phage tail sheath protein FI
MVETLHPGVFVEEKVLTQGPIVGVTTANGAMMGYTSKGILNVPVLVNNWTKFLTKYGGFRNDDYTAYAAYNFFQNGGRRLYVCRVALSTDLPVVATVTLNDTAGTPVPTLKVDAVNGGVWGNSLKISIADGTLDPDNQFKITVKLGTEVVEVWDNLSMIDANERFCEGIINGNSEYIVVTDLDSATPAPDDRPAVQTDTALATGDDGTAPADADYDFSLYNSISDNLIIAAPGKSSATVIQAGIAYCEGRGDCIFVADVPSATTTASAAKTFRQTTLNVTSSYGTLYYPWVLISDPNGIGTNPVKYVPPSGFVLGIMCRMDNEVGVWKAPAGLGANLVGALGLNTQVLDSDQDQLNPIGVNCIRIFTGQGIVLFGARTLSNNITTIYINVRRLLNYIKSSFRVNFAFAVFEPNDSKLWTQLVASGTAFLTNLWSQRGLYGENADKAFFIKCDSEINTQTSIDLGQLKYQVGVRPTKPAEFIIITITQWDGGVTVSE